jgi:Tol biopolymer transport system component
LGLVLYELASGQRPFRRQTLQEIAARKTGPMEVSTKVRVPNALERLIDGMLEPDEVRRISMQQASDALGRLERRAGQGQLRKWGVSGVFLTLFAALVVLLVYRSYLSHGWGDSSARVNLSRMAVRRLASQPGFEDNPALSPDGRWVSCLYRARPTDAPQLQVHSTRDARPIVIETGDLAPEGPAAWSPDSTELVFSAKQGSNEHAIYRVARTGGAIKRIHNCRPRSDSGCELDWSPDGKTLAIADRFPGNSELYVLDLVSGQRRDLITLDRLYVTTPRFSPDGKWVAYLKQPVMTTYELFAVPADGGQPRRITQNPPVQRGFVWNPDGSGLLAFSVSKSQKSQMWQFSLDGKAQYLVGELDSGRAADVAISRRKGSFAWVRDLSVNSLSRMAVDQPGRPSEPLLSSAAVDVDPEWSRSGRMVFRSDRSGMPEVWIANADGSNPWQATRFRGTFVGDPHWSPDGDHIAFTVHSNKNADIFVMRCGRGATSCDKPLQLTHSPQPDANPTWSADGRWIYFSSSRSGEFEVWRMPADGSGEPERITWKGGYLARESADGKWLVFSKLWNPPGFWRIPLPAQGPGQVEIPIALNIPFKAGATWALGTNELFYYPSEEDPAVPFPDVKAVNITTGATRNLPVGKVRLGRGLGLSPDEHWLLRSQNDRAQTLVMIAE